MNMDRCVAGEIRDYLMEFYAEKMADDVIKFLDANPEMMNIGFDQLVIMSIAAGMTHVSHLFSPTMMINRTYK